MNRGGSLRGWLFALSVLLLLGCARGKPAPTAAEPARPVPVLTAKAAARNVPLYLEGLGTLSAWKTVRVQPQVDGRLVAVVFRDGQNVKRGELLARLDASPFWAQLNQASAALLRDKALLANHRTNLRRFEALRGQDHVSQQAVDDQRAVVAQYEGAVAMDRAQIQAARLNLSYARITAPIDGVMGVRLVDEGNVVQARDPSSIGVITQIDPIAVLFTLPQDDLPRITPRLGGEPLVVEVYSRDGEVLLGRGKLLAIDNQINQDTASVRLKAVLQNPNRALWPNQFVRARLQLAQKKDALLIPAAAVQRGPKGSFVYVVQGSDTAAQRPVEVESLIGDQALIARGLAAGDEVVCEGQNQLRPGARITTSPLDAAAQKGAEATKKSAEVRKP